MGSVTNYFPGVINDDHFEKWLDQFANNDKEIICRLLPYYNFFTSDDVFSMLNILFSKLCNEYKIEISSTIFVPIGYICKSGVAISYFFRRENYLDERLFISIEDLNEEQLEKVKTIVFLDDFIGSGEYISKIKLEYIQNIHPKFKNNIQFIFACMVGYKQGIDVVADNLFKPCIAKEIPYSHQPLHKESIIYSQEEKMRAEQVLYQYNKPLKPNHPFGYGNIQGLVSFFFATPNNTFPMFWSSNDNWIPLFPRGDSYRDPKRLIMIPSFLKNRNILASDFNSRILASNEVTDLLFHNFQSLDKMNIMSEIFNQINLDEQVIKLIVNALYRLQSLKHEGKSLCTSFIVVKKEDIDSILDKIIIDANELVLNEIDMIEKHIQLIDGWTNTLVIDNTGCVLGIMEYEQPDRTINLLKYLPNRHQGIAYTSYLTHGLLFLFTEDNKIVIYFNGNRIMTKKGNDWHIQGTLKDTSDIAIEHGVDPMVLEKAIELAFKLSNDQRGSLLTIGDEEDVKKHSSKMGQLLYSYNGKSILKTNINVLMSLASQDGATIISSKGEIIDTMVRLEPPYNIQVVSESDKGTRHNTAKKMSAATKAIYITVSDDGPISIYANGQRILRVLG